MPPDPQPYATGCNYLATHCVRSNDCRKDSLNHRPCGDVVGRDRKDAGVAILRSGIRNGLVKLTSPLSESAVNAAGETQPPQPVQVGTEHDEQLGGGQ